jgi:alpha-tubulin suppressor-like RCC1 family protein
VPTLAGVAQLAAGEHHTCARLADNTVRCWGRNDRGQLGDGTRRPRPGPVTPVGLGPVRAVVVAYEHSCAVRNDGGVWCWGRDLIPTGGEGENNTDSPRPRALRNLSSVAELALGHYFAYARFTDGTLCLVRGGGADTRGSERTLTGVTAVAAGERWACLTTADTVRCWDQEDSDGPPAPAVVPGLQGAAQVVVGRNFACARNASGAVSCWGDNEDGALGTPRVAADAPTPVPVRWP